jgi:probable sporulation protein (polysaccharide deacetylase family)
MKRRKWLVLLGMLAFVLAFLNQSASIDSFVSSVKLNGAANSEEDSFRASANLLQEHGRQNRETEDAKLLANIKQEAEKLREEPLNARIDPVWKAIPGYNGIEVNVGKTFQLARLSQDKNNIPFVYDEVEPKVGLSDLEPQPIYKGNPKKPMVSLMINVAWGNEYLPGMLETLNKENVRATFFLDGSWLSKNINMARKILEQGHELSNHAYSHKNMSGLSRQRAIEEILKTERLLREELGVNNRLFAPPSGDYDMETVKIAHELGLQTILWTIDTVDWQKPAPEFIVRKINSRLEPGAMILMHPTASSSRALPAMIREIKGKGLTLGTVSELISSKRVNKVETSFGF